MQNFIFLVSGGPTEFRMQAHRNDVGQNMFSTYFSRGTSGSPSIVQDGDTLLEIQPKGYDGANYHRAAEIDFQVDGTPGTNDMPGRIMFWTTADGASAPTERMRIKSDGDVEIYNGAVLKVYRPTNSAYAGLFMDSGEKLYIRNSWANKDIVMLRTGEVGIGTNNPANNLHILTDANAEGLLIKSTGNTYSDIVLDSNRSTADSNLGQFIGKWNGTQVATITFLSGADTTNKDDGEIAFYTAPAGTVGEKMRINSSGLVGIGTNDPVYTLQGNGTNGGIIGVTRTAGTTTGVLVTLGLVTLM